MDLDIELDKGVTIYNWPGGYQIWENRTPRETATLPQTARAKTAALPQKGVAILWPSPLRRVSYNNF